MLYYSSGLLFYVHDGSDSTTDSFTIMAAQTEGTRKSLPLTVHITVRPLNDQHPEVVNNNLLVSSIAQISCSLARIRCRLAQIRCGLAQIRCILAQIRCRSQLAQIRSMQISTD